MSNNNKEHETLYVNIGNPTQDNFWVLNPQFLVFEPFKSYYKNEKDKNRSSKMMIGIAMCYDPNSKLFNLPLEDRIEILNKDYLVDTPKFDEQLVEMYVKLTTTPAQKNLSTIEELLNKRTRFLQSVDYDLENAEKLDKFIAGTVNIFKSLALAKNEVEKARGMRNEGGAKADTELSLADKGLI